MMKQVLLLVLVLVLCRTFATAQIPRSMSYQGVLTDSVGVPKPEGAYPFTFRLYDASSGGNVVGIQGQTLQVTRGLFHTVFDQLLQGVTMDRPYWLSLQLGAEGELSPRIPLTAVAYSLSSIHADTARYAISAPGQSFVDSARVAGTLPNNAVTSDKISNGAVSSAKIASGQVVKSLNGAHDNVVLTATGGAGIVTSGDTIVINAGSAGTGWSLIGNAGTTAGANFIGTLDAQPFEIHTAGVNRARITTKGQIEIQNTGGSVFLGTGAGANDDLATRQNVFVGEYAGFSNSSGAFNVAGGYQALYSNTTGNANTASGFKALFSNSSGTDNVAVGFTPLYHNNAGTYNTAVGNAALYNNAGGNYNTACGYASLGGTTNSLYNTALGYLAGRNHDNGYNNVFLGANTDVDGAGYYNVIAIGQGTIVTGSSTARFGNSATVSYGGWANWTNVSDGRFKKNVKTTVPGLEFITKLRPITYNLDATALDAFLHQDSKPDQALSGPARADQTRALQAKEAITQTGFVAQEVEAAAKELGYDFSGVDAPKSQNDYYGLRYAEFVVPLVKAMQEQQQMIEAQQKEINDLKAIVQSLTRSTK
jgi:trimeric autotransporter adhesin